MAVERFSIESREQWLELRQQDVTASVAGALLGVHPYVSAYALWCLKTGRIETDAEMTPAMQRGLLLETPAIALLRSERPNWRVTKARQYFRDPNVRLGATPDAYADCPERGRGLIQIKTVESSVFRRNWRDEETGEVVPPLWIAVQAIVEAHLTGRKWAAVAALTVGFGMDLHIVDVPMHAGVYERVCDAVRDFWSRVNEGREPEPDYGRDGGLLDQLYGQDNGQIVDLTGDNALPALMDEKAELAAQKTAADKRLKEIKAEVIAKLGEAQAGRIADGRLIVSKTIHRKPYSVAASSYRGLTVKDARMEAAE